MRRLTKNIIDKEQFEKLIMYGFNENMIADFFRFDTRTIRKWCHKTYKSNFEDVYKEFYTKGNFQIMTNLFGLSEKNTT